VNPAVRGGHHTVQRTTFGGSTVKQTRNASETPDTSEGISWHFYFIVGVIGVGVIMLVAKAFGLL
jgi:hypothetical protein